ncbi:hypothetical protein H4R33_006863, partial [Dimargaris cristalligena]
MKIWYIFYLLVIPVFAGPATNTSTASSGSRLASSEPPALAFIDFATFRGIFGRMIIVANQLLFIADDNSILEYVSASHEREQVHANSSTRPTIPPLDPNQPQPHPPIRSSDSFHAIGRDLAQTFSQMSLIPKR